MKNLIRVLFLGSLLLGSVAKSEKVNSLDTLLSKVKQSQNSQNQENLQREKKFLAAYKNQSHLLKKAKFALATQKSRSTKLKVKFDTQEKKLTKIEAELNLAMGGLGEMFGVVRQAAGEAKSQFENSPITVQVSRTACFYGKTKSSEKLANDFRVGKTLGRSANRNDRIW